MTNLIEPRETRIGNLSTVSLSPFYFKYGPSYFAILGVDKIIQVDTSTQTTSIRYISLSYPTTVPYTLITKEEFHEKLGEVKTFLTKKLELLQLAEAPRVDTTKDDDMRAESDYEKASYDKVEAREEY